MLTRRQFTAGAAAVASVSLSGARAALSEPAWFKTPLPLPQLFNAAKDNNAVALKIAAGRHAFLPGKPTLTYGYSAPVLGPVIRVRRGDEIQMTVDNGLDRATTVHWHGLLVPSEVDGGPHNAIKAGGTWRPVLKIDQPATTAWFHPHPHHDTARQVYMGLAGMIIVDDGSDDRLGLPRTYGVDDIPVILQDRRFFADGSLFYDRSPMAVMTGMRGDTVIVNGAIAPAAKVPRGLVRLRFLDGANARNFDLRFRDGRKFHVIASDGGFLAAPVAVSALTISPGERFEVLVDFSDGQPVLLDTGPDEQRGMMGGMMRRGFASYYGPVMRFEPTATPGAIRTLPARLVEPAIANPRLAVARRQLVLNAMMGPGMMGMGMMGGPRGIRSNEFMGINGRPFDMSRIDVSAKQGTTELWEIVSADMAHPFHIHGASFRVLSINGRKPHAHLAGWKDVILVEGRAEILVAFDRPATRQHPFMFHCHILEHEDAGMMGQYVCA